jgi:hypothetical protein
MAIQNLDNILHKILARAILSYRAKVGFVMAANRDYDDAVAQKGESINVPISKAIAARDAAVSNVQPSLTNTDQDTVAIELTEWREAPFSVTDLELTKIDQDEHFMPMAMHEAIRVLAEEANTFMAGKYTEFYNWVGTAATTPFGSDTSAIIAADKKLNQNNVPTSGRSFIMDTEAYANALALDSFHNADKMGRNGVVIEADLGRVFNFDTQWDNAVQTHTTGAATAGNVLTDGGGTAGDTTLVADAFTVKPSPGDLFTIAGDTTQYVVVSATDLSSGESTMTIQPPLAADVADGVQLTFVASHTANMALHRDALTIAERPLKQTSLAPSTIASMTDPLSGVSMRLEIVRMRNVDEWRLQVLYGGKSTRPYAGLRVLG